jgi:hypothetical protein
VGRGLKGKDNGGNVNNIQYKSDWNCHFRSPPCIIIYPNKNYNNKKQNYLRPNQWKHLAAGVISYINIFLQSKQCPPQTVLLERELEIQQ